MSSIATIIDYCSNDFRFIDRCIEEVKIFSKQIIIPVCDHFFDGTPENYSLLAHTYAKHPDCTFLEFAYLPNRLYSAYHPMHSDDPNWSMYWGATPRYIGWQYLDPKIDTVLFLDSDEIMEGKRFQAWIESGAFQAYDAVRLGAYYYALRATLRAEKIVNLPLFVKKEAFSPLTLFNDLDRLGAYQAHVGPKRDKVVGIDGYPLLHHYSWVRTKEECLLKARTWGHRHDEDWPQVIEEAFSGNMKRLFGTEHTFNEIPESYFDPLQVEIPANHVKRISLADVRQREVYALL